MLILQKKRNRGERKKVSSYKQKREGRLERGVVRREEKEEGENMRKDNNEEDSNIDD